MKGVQVFASIILLVNCASAGLLQSIRDAAFIKEIDPAARDSRALGVPPFTQIPLTEPQPSFFEQYYPQISVNHHSSSSSSLPPCPPGDFLCLAQRNMKTTLGSDMSNAIIKSVASLMTEMLNSTISRSLDIVHQAQGSHDPEKEAQARAAMSMVGTALSTVSSKVIQGVASFVKVSLSGAMWDLFDNVVKVVARGGGGGGSVRGVSFRGLGATGSRGVINNGQKAVAPQEVQMRPVVEDVVVPPMPISDPALVTPSNMYIPSQNGNEIKRAGVEVVEEMQ